MKILTLLLSLSAFAAPGPSVDPGSLPVQSYPDLADKAAQVWDYVKGATGATVAPPRVFLYDFAPAEGSPEFRSFRDGWIAAHPEIWQDWQAANPGKTRGPGDFPFPAGFQGFYFTGAGTIELSPRVFTAYLYQDPDGVLRDHSGVGYYNLGHELHHYALEVRGVPIKLHHCVFLLARKGGAPSFMETLVNHLIDTGVSSFVARIRAYQGEVSLNPCSALSAEERAAAQDWASKL